MPTRCAWVKAGNTLYEQYHDEEWGVPVYGDNKLFEFLLLEGSQAGLSWETVLKKRNNYRLAFANFNAVKVAKFDSKDIARLLQDEGIIRNRLKIEAAINNAKKFLDIQVDFGSFSNYQWRFVANEPLQNNWQSISQIPVSSPEAEAFSKDLKARGFKFVGQTIIYAHMQAIGMVNDHTVNCFRYKEIRDLSQARREIA